MQMTQSSPHIMLGYSCFPIHSGRACVSLSVKYRGMHIVQIHQLVQANFKTVYPHHCHRRRWRRLSRRRRRCRCHLVQIHRPVETNF